MHKAYIYSHKKLQALRQRANISVNDLLYMLRDRFGFSVSDSSIFNWESGAYTPSAQVVGYLVSIYGARPEDVYEELNEDAVRRLRRESAGV